MPGQAWLLNLPDTGLPTPRTAWGQLSVVVVAFPHQSPQYPLSAAVSHRHAGWCIPLNQIFHKPGPDLSSRDDSGQDAA